MSDKCPLCKHPVEFGEGVYDAAKCAWWHGRCIEIHIELQIEAAEKKAQRGTLTIEEAEALKELQIELAGLKQGRASIDRAEVKRIQAALAGSTPVFTKKDPRYIDAFTLGRRRLTAAEEPMLLTGEEEVRTE